MKRKMILITIIVAVLTILFQAALAQTTDYTNWLPVVISEPASNPEALPAGDYLSRSGGWAVAFTEPKSVIEKEFADGYMWFLVEISYKDYPSITAWVREYDALQ